MSCRTTAAGSALTTFARLHSGLTDVQTLSAYHALRNEGRGQQAPTEQQWQEFVTGAQEQVRADGSLTDARRRSLLGRLDRAAQERVDGATYFALRNISGRATRQTETIDGHLHRAAESLGVDYDTARGRYLAYQNEIDRSRTAATPAGYSDGAVEAARAMGLPEDRGSIVAMQRLLAEADDARAQQALTLPQRIERQPMNSGTIAEAGYDPDGGRLEVVFHRNGGQSRVYAYRGVPAHVWQEMQSGSAGQAYNRHVRNHAEYRYATQADADRDGAARQCGDCGQFAASAHACPVRIEREEAYRRARVAAEQAAVRERLAREEALRAEAERRDIAEREAAEAAAVLAAEQAAEAARVAEAAQEAVVSRPEPRQVYFRSRWRYAGSVSALGHLTRENGVYDNIVAPRNLAEMRTEAGTGPVVFGVQYHFNHYRPTGAWEAEGLPENTGRQTIQVTADAVYDRPGRGQHDVQFRNMRCSCSQYRDNGDCPHVNYAVGRLRNTMLPANRAAATPRTEEERQEQVRQAQAVAEQAMARDWTRNEEHAAEARRRWAAAQNPQDTYSTNFAAFHEDYQAALDRKAAGEEPIPYMAENALGGLADPGSGRGFGVELEFDFPSSVNKSEALRAIGRDLHAEGLTSSAYQQGYHAGQRAGYTENHQGGWSYEMDCTVSGEIVSPVMYDTPETWSNIAKVCEIVKRHGGVANAKTGSHVHVSSPNTTAGTGTELVRMMNQHEDVMYRVSSNPARGTHRPTRWCGPNRDVPPAGYNNIGEAQRYNNSHNFAVNLQSVSGRGSDHAEIRHWDGSLSAPAIQTQIKVSVAAMVAAERNAASHGTGPMVREPLGAHARRLAAVVGRSRRALTSDELRDDTATARSFADTLFTRREDKAQFTALFAVNKWTKRRD